MQYRDAYAFFFFLIFIMIVFNYKDYTDRLKTEKPKFQAPKTSPLLYNVTRIRPLNRSLTLTESDNVAKCISSHKNDARAGEEMASTNSELRWKTHSYLTPQSIVVSLGGRNIEDAVELIGRYKPRLYIILEPVTQFYQQLKTKFAGSPNVIVYNFGLSGRDDMFRLKVDSGIEEIVKVVNAKDFFPKLGIGFFDVDLLTMNCGGCEYDVLDALLASTLIYHFKNIQFQTHQKHDIYDSVRRYCQYQELLKYTHHNVFLHKFNWESWTRNQ